LAGDAGGGPFYTVITRRTLTTRRYEKRWIVYATNDAFEIVLAVRFKYRF
jgi:hypothetical protein